MLGAVVEMIGVVGMIVDVPRGVGEGVFGAEEAGGAEEGEATLSVNELVSTPDAVRSVRA